MSVKAFINTFKVDNLSINEGSVIYIIKDFSILNNLSKNNENLNDYLFKFIFECINSKSEYNNVLLIDATLTFSINSFSQYLNEMLNFQNVVINRYFN